MTDDELAAVVVAVRAMMQQPGEHAPPQMSAWKLEARRASIDTASFDDLRMTNVQ